MHERFELVMPLDPVDVFFVGPSYCTLNDLMTH